MNKNMRYWAIGILAAVIVLLIVGFALGGSRNNQDSSETENASQPQSQTQQNAHSGHTAAAESENPNLDNATAEDNVNRYLQKQDEIMMDMMHAMENIPKSGNASIDFLNGMIPHHESAIDMAEAYLSNGGENDHLKELAQAIITVQKEEITQMKDLIRKYEKEGHKDEDKENAYLSEYDLLMDHDHTMSKSGASTLEHAFAEGMILHHQMAVDMAKSILDYTDYEEIKTLAQNIITAQEQEIEEMRQYIH